MSAILEPMISHRISVVTNDGRVFVGVLKGFDQSTNVVLEECEERVYHQDSGVQQLQLGVYLIRGDNIAVVGEVDVDVDARISLSSVRAAPLKPVLH